MSILFVIYFLLVETSIVCWNWLMLTHAFYPSETLLFIRRQTQYARIIFLAGERESASARDSSPAVCRPFSVPFVYDAVSKWHGWSPELKAVGSLQNWVCVWMTRRRESREGLSLSPHFLSLAFSLSIWWLLEKWISSSLFFFSSIAYTCCCLLQFFSSSQLFSVLHTHRRRHVLMIELKTTDPV